MNILVCLKQVPDTGMDIKISQDKMSLNEDSLKWVLNPYDEFALEAALQLKNHFTKVFALSLGPKRVKESLIHALALGADEAFHIETEKNFKDPLLLSQHLSSAIKNLPDVKLILCGKVSADSNNFAVPQMISQSLGFHCVTNINLLEYKNNNQRFRIKREMKAGKEEILSTPLPVLFSVDKNLNQPRYPNLPGIMKAKKKPFHVLKLENEKEDKIKLLSLKLPESRLAPKIIEGDVKTQAESLVSFLKEKEKIL